MIALFTQAEKVQTDLPNPNTAHKYQLFQNNTEDQILLEILFLWSGVWTLAFF